jgi:HTH-type transcriptional regulator / antitoxin HipB
MAKPQKTSPTQETKIIVRNPTQLGGALMRFRKLDHRNQQFVGERAGIKQPMVSLVESGAPGTSLKTLFKVMAALDLELVVRRRQKSSAWSRSDR